MKQAAVRPTGVERTFGEDELIVSKTDAKGIIRYANEPFLRISGYPEPAVIGQPHNLIRHPDMPRAVFHLLWETISRGQELFAYIVNLASDGAHYWVLAHVTPSMDSTGRIVGYHSNRRTPDRAAVDTVADLYARLRREEQQGNGRDALTASRALLEATLAAQGLDYDRFVWALAGQKVAR